MASFCGPKTTTKYFMYLFQIFLSSSTLSISLSIKLNFGHLRSSYNFSDPYSLFCRYSFQSGPNWTLVTGYSEGQTASCTADQNKVAEWAQPLDLHYISTGIQGWPKLILQVSCLDPLGRSWIIGYGSCSIPSAPGHHTLKIPCWAPAATTAADKLRQAFIGGAHELTQTDIIHLGSDRYKLITKSKGDVELNIYLVLRNFTRFGVEYK